ncbi:Sua5/YciO/YrdC/YwlC family protein [Candidatus Albibeggiatoa sp. nov. BB20]|uniref:Sua5/YciO/YrdC/YwlC family protein n=1 Tax=Candidatus Albibeggiatoa sp. nov. BB20 TaxID=3162723 RepID=UPI0033658D51
MSYWQYQHAKYILKQAGIIAYPTEAVYGLGCDPDCESAVNKILTLKQRHWSKGLILIAYDFSQLERYVLPLNSVLEQQVLTTWEQKKVVTWLLPAHPKTPKWLTGRSDKIAVRVTHHPIAAQLCKTWRKPLVSTSANRSGQAPAKTSLRVRQVFQQQLDYVVAGELGTQDKPSEIRDALTQEVLRG